MGTHGREWGSHVREFGMVEVGDLRERLEVAVQAMIDLLDGLDGDPCAEDGGDGEGNLAPTDDEDFDQ